MDDAQDLSRAMSDDEVTALGPLPDPDTVSPTTARVEHAPPATAEVHLPGMLPTPTYDPARFAADGDPFPPPRSITEEG